MAIYLCLDIIPDKSINKTYIKLLNVRSNGILTITLHTAESYLEPLKDDDGEKTGWHVEEAVIQL